MSVRALRTLSILASVVPPLTSLICCLMASPIVAAFDAADQSGRREQRRVIGDRRADRVCLEEFVVDRVLHSRPVGLLVFAVRDAPFEGQLVGNQAWAVFRSVGLASQNCARMMSG